MANNLTKIALVTSMALGAGSCAPVNNKPSVPSPIKTSDQAIEERARKYLILCENEPAGLIVDHSKYADVRKYLAEKKAEFDKKDPADRLLAEIIGKNPVEQPKTKQKKGLFDSEENEWEYSVSPFYARKMALSAQGTEPEDMNMFGVEFKAQKGRISAHAALSKGTSKEKDSGTESGMDWKGQLEIDHTTLSAGLGYDLVNGNRFRLTARAGLTYTDEDVDGYLQMATPTGTQRMDINDSTDMFGIQGGLEAGVKLGDNIELSTGVNATRYLNSDNVNTELTIPFVVKFKF